MQTERQYRGSLQPVVRSRSNCDPAPLAESAGSGGSGRSLSVLFVAKDSIYKSLGCDCYDAERNALTYHGNNPVVAHPPCQLWGKMAKINHLRWGGEHNRPGNDGGCFQFALDTVNRCGGVLEHPAETYAWMTHGLPYPGLGWTRWKQGWVCEVWQSAYGHRAQKRTWLYYCGDVPPPAACWDRPTGTHQIGFHDQRGKAANKPTLGRREANATPEAFALYLLKLANTARCRRSTTMQAPISRAGHPATLSLGGGGAERAGDENRGTNEGEAPNPALGEHNIPIKPK